MSIFGAADPGLCPKALCASIIGTIHAALIFSRCAVRSMPSILSKMMTRISCTKSLCEKGILDLHKPGSKKRSVPPKKGALMRQQPGNRNSQRCRARVTAKTGDSTKQCGRRLYSRRIQPIQLLDKGRRSLPRQILPPRA
jgi:hypothetical protein